MKNNDYDIILMRGPSSIRRLRLSALWLKLFVFSVVFLLVGTIFGGYYSFFFWGEKKKMAHLNELQAESLFKMEKKLKRLENVKTMYEIYREDELRILLAGQQERSNSEMHFSHAIDLRSILDPVNMDIVRVSNVQARLINNRMQVYLEVNNMAGKGRISGRIFLYLISNCGVMKDIGLDEADLGYAILRFRTMEAVFDLPEDMDGESLFGLRIMARDDLGNTVFSEVFPLSSILI